MSDLGISTLSELSPMIPERPTSAGWTLVYRDLCEWAVLYELCHKEFASDTVLLHDGVNTGPIQQRAPVENGGAVVRSYWLTGASSTAPASLSFAPDRAAELPASRLVCRVRALASWSR